MTQIKQITKKYCDILKKSSFLGEVDYSMADRLVMATDNSIYQILPQAVLFPKSHNDIKVALNLSQEALFSDLYFAPRGGGTGTNGQSLTSGIVIDCSRYMTKIIELNLEEKWVKVQPGVVLDSLNSFLKPHGFFFAPTVSPSNRATIGGMIGTDASGKGSRVYGKTCDHILSLKNILFNGDDFETSLIDSKNAEELKKQPGFLSSFLILIESLVTKHQSEITNVFSKLSRCLTGYNLLQVYNPTCRLFNLNTLIAGSEGTLAVTTEATLKLTPIPKHKRLIIVHYPSLHDALLDAPKLIMFNPLAIETLDEHVLEQLSKASSFESLQHFFNSKTCKTQAIHYIEIVADTPSKLDQESDALIQYLKLNQNGVYFETTDLNEISLLWQIRKQCVGLLLKTNSITQPIPFIEDTSVPVENLAPFIQEFTALLIENKLSFGFYGHVDVGCIHMRPGINLQDQSNEKLIRNLTLKLTELTKKYDGVLWGEHGRGFRSETAELFFGSDLIHVFREIKSAFDPLNKLNPGKIVLPLNSKTSLSPLLSPLRGQYDRQINTQYQLAYSKAISCNGNGACFDSSQNSVMCPSYKVTQDRKQSPKGRSSLLREWLRQKSVNGQADAELNLSVFDSLNSCLSCKACVTGCPVEINIPHYKAQFLYEYYKTNRRPLRDYLISTLEPSLPLCSKFPRVSNFVFNNPASVFFMNKLGLKDLPKLSYPSLSTKLSGLQKTFFSKSQLKLVSNAQNQVFLVQDAFTSFYDSTLVITLISLLERAGITVHILPFRPTGKPLHILGKLDDFNALVKNRVSYLNEISALNIPIIGIEPSVTLSYQDDYKAVLDPSEIQFEVLSIQDYLLSIVDDLKLHISGSRKNYTLLSHCTERTQSKHTINSWQKLFQLLSIKLTIAQVGCCGMAGIYGHQTENFKDSKRLYKSTWEGIVNTLDQKELLVTGFSCKKQIQRFSKLDLFHPVDVLYQLFESNL
jgi:FAD/FMN-containing dehydrogenase/Fe-S oxidoreductase